MERNYLDKMIAITGRRASYLDLGCGTGVPIMKYLLEQGIDVTGVDGSNHMLEIAKKNLPSAKFIATDPQRTKLLFCNSIDSFPLHLLCYTGLGTREAVCRGYKCNHKIPRRPLDCYCQDTHSYIPPGNCQVECHIDTGL